MPGRKRKGDSGFDAQQAFFSPEPGSLSAKYFFSSGIVEVRTLTKRRRVLDWAAIERDFCATQVSNRQLARQHGISEGAIRKRAKLGSWLRLIERKRIAGPIAPVPCSGLTAQQLASERVDLAIGVLADVCANGRSAIARVRAAKLIMALAEGNGPAASKRTS